MTDNTPSISGVTAVILAGGLGTRLRTVVADRPKVMAEVHGRPFLTFLFDNLELAGFRSVVLCTGYLGEQIEDHFGDRYAALSLSYSREPRPLGTAGALRWALPRLNSDPLLVMNGDTFAGADLKAFWNWYCRTTLKAGIMLARVTQSQRYGSVTVDDNEAVREFREKGKGSEPSWINAGIYLLKREVIETIPEDIQVSLEYDVFPKLIGRGLYAFAGAGRFLDIGTPEDFALAKSFFADQVER